MRMTSTPSQETKAVTMTSRGEEVSLMPGWTGLCSLSPLTLSPPISSNHFFFMTLSFHTTIVSFIS